MRILRFRYQIVCSSCSCVVDHWHQEQLCTAILYPLGYTAWHAHDETGHRASSPQGRRKNTIDLRGMPQDTLIFIVPYSSSWSVYLGSLFLSILYTTVIESRWTMLTLFGISALYMHECMEHFRSLKAASIECPANNNPYS